MERDSMSVDREIQYYQNVSFSQLDLEIQHIPIKIAEN